MNRAGQINLSSPVADVWDKLMDPQVLSKCIMGCDNLQLVGENKYHAVLSIGIASVKGKYDADISLEEIHEQQSYRLVVHGEGNPGIVDAQGLIKLSAGDGIGDENTTLLAYDYEANVGGKIAAVGQRMLGGVAKLIINDFFKRLKKQVEAERSA